MGMRSKLLLLLSVAATAWGSPKSPLGLHPRRGVGAPRTAAGSVIASRARTPSRRPVSPAAISRCDGCAPRGRQPRTLHKTVNCWTAARVDRPAGGDVHHAVAATRRLSERCCYGRGGCSSWRLDAIPLDGTGQKTVCWTPAPTRQPAGERADGRAHVTLGELDVPRSTAGLPAHIRKPRTGIEVGAA